MKSRDMSNGFFDKPIERDWVECVASLACIAIFFLIGASIAYVEFMGNEPIDSNILVYILGFATREVGALSIGRGNGGSAKVETRGEGR